MRSITQAVVLAVTGGLVACGGADNELKGSINESFSLDFDRVEVRYLVTTDELSIEYLKDLGNTVTKPVKVVVDATDLPLAADTRLTGATYLERVVVQRETESGGDFPAVTGGSVEFESINLALTENMAEIDGRTVTFFSEPSGDIEVQGEFDAVFDNGRTLFGKFRSDLRVDDPDAPVGQ
ncbi:MAG: hypothetical protein AAF654_13200 [Myxococcota bacterium]